ncbi:WD40 repeat domain-containing protein [Streptomonospora halophila]
MLLQLFLVLAASLLGVVTNYATDGDDAPLPLSLLEQIAVPGLVVLLIVLVAGHVVAYGLENPPPPKLAWDPTRPPYPGLEAFREDEAAVYFGREAQTTQIVRRLHQSRASAEDRFTAIIGASGIGKSSLLHAGVLPRIRGQRWSVLPVIVPGTDPLGALARALAAELGESPEAVARRVRRAPAEFADLFARYRHASGRRFAHTLVVIDQLEELATLTGEGDRRLFLDGLTDALGSDRHLHVVATLRVEFLGDMLAEDRAGLFTSPIALGALDRAGLAEVIERPAEAARLKLEPGLVERIVADTGSGDALPLLAYLLQELYLRVGTGKTATIEHYRALGGVDGALSRHADQVSAELRSSSDMPDVLRTLLLFVTVSSSDASRRRVPLGSLSEEQRRIVDAFIEARLLVSDVNGGEPTAHVAHEALFRQWAPLRQEVEAHMERLRQRAELERWTADWQRSGRSPDYLLTGDRLELAEQWLAGLREVGQDTPAVAVFVDASRRRDRGFLLRVSQQIAEFVLANVERYPELAVLLCLAALGECAPTPTARRALLASLAHSHARGVYKGHTDTVRNLAWSPDGRLLATASRDGTARIWDAESGALRTELTGHLGMVESVSWSPDSARVATASRDGTVRLWDVESGTTVLRLADATDVVRGVAWSPTGAVVAGASRDRTVRVWDADTGSVVARLAGHEDNVLGLAWSPDGQRLASASHDQTVIVWRVATAERELTLRGHQDFVEGVHWAPEGGRIATASGDGTVRVWDAASGRRSLLVRAHEDRVWNVAWSPDGAMLATASADRTARVFSADDAQQQAVLRGHEDNVWCVAWSPDGTRLATGSEDQTLRIWDLLPRSVEEWSLTRHGAALTSVDTADRDGSPAVVGGCETGELWMGGADTEAETGVVAAAHEGKVRAVALSPVGSRVASGGTDRRARLWSFGSGEPRHVLEHEGAIVEAVAWSPDSRRVATGAQDRLLRIWDAQDGSLLTVLSGHQDWVVGLAFSPSGRMIASASDDRTARIWDIGTGRERAVLHGHDNWVDCVAWAPDETRVATSSADWTVRIWDVASGKTAAVLRGHEGRVPAVAWSPDGRRIATGSYDRSVRVWDGGTGEEREVVGMHRDRVTSVVWTADSRLVVSGSRDTTIRGWRAETATDELQAFARTRVFRALTEEERRAHMLALPDRGQ